MKHTKKPNIVRGGVAIPLNRANYYLMKGRKHTTGGIDIGKDLEVEDGEVMSIGRKYTKVFSAVPFLNGKSPAQKVLEGENPNKVFQQQENFKDRNGIKDDGTKATMGTRKKYTTILSNDDEKSFQEWYAKVAKYKNLNPNPDDEQQGYDYRGYWKNENKEDILKENSNSHFTDKYKTPNHPTFSDESIYHSKETPGGKWIQDKNGTWLFKHSDYTIKNKNKTHEYLLDSGEGYIIQNDTIVPMTNKLKQYGGRIKATTGIKKETTEYTIQPGDSLSVIAKNLTGNANNYLNIANANNIDNPDKIKAGDKLIIPIKFNKALKRSEIPTSNKTIVIDNYSPNYNYIVENDKIYYSVKGRDHWVDISDNDKARKNLYGFLEKYDYRGYENDEKNIAKRIKNNNFNYKYYRDSLNNSITNKVVPNKLNTNTLIDIDSIDISDKQKEIEKILQQYVSNKKENDNENKEYSIKNLFEKGVNWIERQIQKRVNIDKEVSIPTVPDIIDSEYGIIPESITGDTIKINRNNRRYIIPSSLDLTENVYGYRNRGDYTEINSEAAPITAFHKFVDFNENMKGTYIGIDENGNLKLGDANNFKIGDKVTRSYSNIVYEFPKDENGNYKWQSDDKHGNRTKNVPMAIVKDEKTGEKKSGFPINILQNKTDLKGTTYGNITGGRVIVQVGNETRLLSGSFDSINKEFEAMKKRQGQDHGIFYTLDNGSYNRGLRTYDKKFTEDDLKSYDNQNNGGGNFLYIKDKKRTFSTDTVLTPNVRTKDSESYKKGHSDINSLEGVVLHHTAFNENDLTNVTNHFLNKNTEASSHVVIGKNGHRRVFAEPEQVTFHAGQSYFNGKDNVNDFMLGIEFQGNTENTPLTNEQIQSAIEYLKPIIRKHNIPLEMITTHENVRNLYNEYRKIKKLGKQAPNKTDLTFTEYNKIINALKESIYYKKEYGGKIINKDIKAMGGKHKPVTINVNDKTSLQYHLSTGGELNIASNDKQLAKYGTKYNNRKKALYGLEDNGKYIVKRGDNLSTIAKNLTGRANNYKAIAEANGITNPDLINEGDILKIPNKLFVVKSPKPLNITGKIEQQNVNTPSMSYRQSSVIPKENTKTKVGQWLSNNKNDLISSGISLAGNAISSIIGYNANKNAIKSMQYTPPPVAKQAVKMKTKINIAPQLDAMRESVNEYIKGVIGNTASSRVAQQRVNKVMSNHAAMLNALYADKENKETALINADRANQQSVINANIDAHNQWSAGKADFENKKSEMLAENKIGLIDNLNSGLQNIIENLDKKAKDNKSILAMAAANPNSIEYMYKAGLLNRKLYNKLKGIS